MTKLYLDTEFNGQGGELISLALVAETGASHPVFMPPGAKDAIFYQACEWQQPTKLWVSQNVVPKLDTVRLPKEQFRSAFHGWIKHFSNPEIICDWHADAEHFARALAGPDYLSSLDFCCRITILRTPPGQPISKNPHNALADALALREWHEQTLALAA